MKAFRLLVNQSATWADWDDEMLKLELQDLQTLEFDLSLTGFDSKELDDLLCTPLRMRLPCPRYLPIRLRASVICGFAVRTVYSAGTRPARKPCRVFWAKTSLC